MRAAIGVLALLVVGLAVYSVVTITGLQSDVSAARGDVAALRTDNVALKAKVAAVSRPTGEWAKASDFSDLSYKVDQATSQLKRVATTTGRMTDCIPELQAELNSLDVSDGYASISQQVSRPCWTIVYGPQSQSSDGA